MAPKIITAREAAAMVKDGDNIAVATFGASGTPEEILMEVEKRFLETGHPCDLGYTHAAGGGSFAALGDGKLCRAEDHLAHTGLITRWYCSHSACSDFMSDQIVHENVAAWCPPLGTVLQIFKDQARGNKGTLTKVGLGTYCDPRFDGCAINDKARKSDLNFVEYIPDFFGEEYLYYKGMNLNIGWMRGTYADGDGNISCDKEPYNLEMLTIAQAVRACGGKVFVEVTDGIVETGSINPKLVKVPGICVDYIVISEHPENRVSTVGGLYNPAFTGEEKIDLSQGGGDTIPMGGNKVLLRRAAMEIQKGMKANFGLGMPQSVGTIIDEEGISDYLTMISESGSIGGVPASGVNFGAHYNIIASSDQGDHFNFFDGGGLDIAMFGLSEVNPNGDLNVAVLNGTVKGVGGFMNIMAGAKNVVVLGTFTAKGIKTEVKDGKLVIVQEGKYKKFIKQPAQLASDVRRRIAQGKGAPIYVTERCVLRATPDGLVLEEIAPGVDLQKDILDQMEFMPIIPEGGPKLMPAEIFQETWGGLRAIVDAKGEYKG